MYSELAFSIEAVKNSFSIEVEVDEQGRYHFCLGSIGFIISPEDREFTVLKRMEPDFFKHYKMPYPSTFKEFLTYCRLCGIEFFSYEG